MPAENLHAIILAGGAGERLGGARKSDLRVGGRPLIHRVAEALGASDNPLLVATGPGTSLPLLPQNAIAIPDEEVEHTGPVAGLAAAVTALDRRGIREGLLLSVAVDTVFLPTDFADRLSAAIGNAAAAAAAWQGQLYPTNALWRLENLSRALPGARSPRSLLASLGAVAVNWTGPVDPFANLNTLDDLLELQRRARQHG
jgi:Molybdopterin-guanine dinucleotide biosynthesis protein A